MKKYLILIILFISASVYASMIMVSGGTRITNDFSSDSTVKALYNFEPSALTTDSKASNTLTASGTPPTSYTVTYKQGNGACDYELDNSEYHSIADASLPDGFPLKNNDAVKDITVCTWVNFESLSSTQGIFTKHEPGTNKRSFAMGVVNDSGYKFYIALGYNSGADAEEYLHATGLSVSTWYHVCASYQNSDKAYSIRVRDSSGNVVGTDIDGTATLDGSKLTVNTSPLMIGNLYDDPDNLYLDGRLDEMVIFNRKITAAEATKIALGTYP
jgi:hypothetical protein